MAAVVWPAPASAQNGWELAATAGAVRTDGDLAGGDAGWTPAWGGRVGRRLGGQVILEAEGWAGSLDSRSVRAAGAHVALSPLAQRSPPVEPLLRFGVEALTVDDDRERGPAFVAGVDLRAGGGGWFVEGGVRNHFLRVEEPGPEPEERDASVWEARLTTGWAWGGDGS